MYLYSDEVKRLREERESQAAELAQLREELRIAQEENEERQREVERLQIEKQQQVSRHLFFAFILCSCLHANNVCAIDIIGGEGVS